MPDSTPLTAEADPKPRSDSETPDEQGREDLDEAQKDAAEEREEEGGYQ